VQSPQDHSKDRDLLTELAIRKFRVSFAAAYIFSYPLVFSPIAYSIGLSYSPNKKRLGFVTDRDAERVVNWASHCYRGHRASEGYLRDIYPINIIEQIHLERRIGDLDLQTWISAHNNRGRLSVYEDKMLWIIDDEYLLSVQHCLDRAKLLLSAFSPE
jgi:hypothetical protein